MKGKKENKTIVDVEVNVNDTCLLSELRLLSPSLTNFHFDINSHHTFFSLYFLLLPSLRHLDWWMTHLIVLLEISAYHFSRKVKGFVNPIANASITIYVCIYSFILFHGSQGCSFSRDAFLFPVEEISEDFSEERIRCFSRFKDSEISFEGNLVVSVRIIRVAFSLSLPTQLPFSCECFSMILSRFPDYVSLRTK